MALRFYLDEHGDEVLEVTPDEFDGVPPMTERQDLTKSERAQIAEILNRRANEIAGFYDEYKRKPEHYGSVELSMCREMDRLRNLAYRMQPPEPQDEDEE